MRNPIHLLVGVALAGAVALPSAVLAGEDEHVETDPSARKTEYDPTIFGPDPRYDDKPYDAKGQEDIYGAKHMNPTQRPALELFRRLYWFGAFRKPYHWFGEANPAAPQLLVFGDVRSTVAFNDNGEIEKGVWANRLNLDVDLRLTATERIHAFFDPIRDNGAATRYEWFGDDVDDGWKGEYDPNAQALFFEGDVGAILAGGMGTDKKFDMPIAGGRMPLLLQNGIWVEDVFDGFAITPVYARNSKLLDISNMDVTFFAGFGNVTSQAVVAPGDSSRNQRARIFGANAFIEAMRGYFELGYGYTEDRQDLGRGYHNFMFSFTRRYRNWVSNSVRLIWNTGQDPDEDVKRTADGFILLIENSLITSKPSNLVPYLNLFYGENTPQSLARLDGILKNTGINFDSDALSGFPKMDDTGHDTWGGALGLEYLASDFSYQIVVELAMLQTHGSKASAEGDQYGVGFLFQYPLTNALIFLTEGIYALRQDEDDLRGIRFELRYKF